MEFSTETLRTIAEQFTAVIMTELKADQTYLIRDLETGMRRWLQALGQMTLEMVLSQADAEPVRQLPCSCGGQLHYQRRRAAQVQSVFDWVHYERSYYASCQCGQGQAPLDERFGLQPGQVTAGLAALLGQAGVQMGFEHSSRFLEPFLLFAVPPNSIRKETQQYGRLQNAREETWMEASQDLEALQAQRRNVTEPPRQLYGALDGAHVRIENRKATANDAEPEQWREMKVGCFYTVEPVPKPQYTARHRKKADIGHQALRTQNMRYFCDLGSVDEFEPLFWGHACQVDAHLATEIIFVCDGAAWIWNLVSRNFPHATQIIDWFHAEERLKKVAQEAFSGEMAREWLEIARTALWEGEVAFVIQACQKLAQHAPEAAKAVTYFRNNAHRMAYDQFRAQGYMISSGPVESECKQIVSLRLKLPGAQWHVSGAVQTAKARAAWLSGQWDPLCRWRDALPLAV